MTLTTLRKLICVLIAGLWTASVFATEARPSTDSQATAPATSGVPDSKQIEKDLQRLPWQQFKSVIESVPKMKADVDAYGPMGWKFVQANYTTYAWKKNIDKLDDAQKKRLVDQILIARRGPKPVR